MTGALAGPDQEALRSLHIDSFADFVNVLGFGYIQDQFHVAGFQSHQFRAMPQLKEKSTENDAWRVTNLQLLSLLRFKEPAAYISVHLPRMDELREAKTRPLDAFEKTALAALRRGEDIEIEPGDERIRMLGSIRALTKCTGCHNADEGDLL